MLQTQQESNLQSPDQSDVHETLTHFGQHETINLLSHLGLLLKERICSLWQQVLSLKSSPIFEKKKKKKELGNLFPVYRSFFP